MCKDRIDFEKGKSPGVRSKSLSRCSMESRVNVLDGKACQRAGWNRVPSCCSQLSLPLDLSCEATTHLPPT